MYILRRLSLLLFICFCFNGLQAQPAQAPPDSAKNDTLPPVRTAPKREFRGAWIATVENIDWPSRPGLSTDQQKKELTDLLNFLQDAGINAVMFQIRPAADAFFSKQIEPWSKWLTGKQGQAPSPFYDPLEFAIKEAHQRGMELHAWFNPYRATNDNRYWELSPNHITRTKPGWFFTYGGKKLFNPGIPEVRQYIVKVILDVVDNYDIDGVHMDDYFYPYPINGQHLADEATFKEYGKGFDDIRDWRRANVDSLIKMIGDSVHKHKPHIKFGVSPFGIWANRYQNPEGSETHGGSSYYELYANTREWVKRGWVDYINPQLYWPINKRAAAFNTLLDWWSMNTYNRDLYIGMAAYRINEGRHGPFKNPGELPDEIRYLRKNPRVQGSVYFSATSLVNDPLGFTDSLHNNFYRYPALPPPMLWLDSIPPNHPDSLKATVVTHSFVQLNWKAPAPPKDNEPVYGYVIYRFESGQKIDLDNPKYILDILYDNNPAYVDDTAQKGKTYLYIVTAIDRLKNESAPSPVAAATMN